MSKCLEVLAKECPYIDCEEHGFLVKCDKYDCRAKKDPRTLEEYKEALEHWKNHSLYCGCSHAK